MANTVIALKKSATPSAVPLAGNLANGELAINYADGKLFYKAANGTIATISSATNSFGTVNANNTLVVADTPGAIVSLVSGSNIDIVGDAINDKITINLNENVVIPSTGTFKVAAVGGDEGGEIKLANAITNSVLVGDIVIDVYQDKLRFYESAGTNRGAFMNLASAATGVGTDLLASIAGTTDATAREWATAAFVKANTANITADLAFNKANAALANSTGTFAGDLTISGNLVTTGNVTLGDASTDTITLNGSTISLGNNQSFDSGTLFVDAVNNRVGIGTTAPGYTLETNGTFKFLNYARGNDTGSAHIVGSAIGASTPVYSFVGSTSTGFATVHPNLGIRILVNGNETARFANNFFGIGITEPTSNLHVNGTANIVTNLTVGGNVFFDNTQTTRIWEPAANTLTIHTASNERLRIDASGNVVIGATSTNYKLEVAGSFAAQTKSFVINHPTKEGQFLRYGSLEGPENGVYVRGKIEGKSIIELPDYWWNLIDENTITVNLTPYGRAQEIWVQSTSSHFIHLNQPADCFFTVFAERKDVDKLVVEY